MDLKSLMNGDVISAISKVAGETKKDTTNVLSRGIPEILSSLTGTASTASGASGLLSTITGFLGNNNAAASANSASGLASLVSGSNLSEGTNLLSSLLGGGNALSSIVGAVSNATSTSTNSTSNILSAAAPALLSVIGGQSSGANSGNLLSSLTGLMGGGSVTDLAANLLGGANEAAQTVQEEAKPASGGFLSGILGFFKGLFSTDTSNE
ncbi:MAG: DUF937 domain-containing protein [Lachnospiraceae bacterium]|nr:DUF937 domain-containing protein [Lachnospiraceae bacterium]MBP5254907.1 DUF937 domain-containing protein [Lachnospiraceae bacterium]